MRQRLLKHVNKMKKAENLFRLVVIFLTVLTSNLFVNVDGQWTQWSEWDNCNNHCGEGVTNRTRFCNSSGFIHENQSDCIGLEIENKTCIGHQCSNGTESDWHIPPISSMGEAIHSVIYGCIIFVPGVMILVSICIKQKRKDHEKHIEARLIESRRGSSRHESLIGYKDRNS